MAGGNVDLVRRGFDALNARDVDAALALFHPDADFDWIESNAPYADRLSERDRVRAPLDEFFGMWDELHWTPEDVFEVEGGHVIAVTHVLARGRDGIELDARGAWLWTIRDGLASRVKLCQTREAALAVLEEERG
jgi:ketosteroid isomerase-like protein